MRKHKADIGDAAQIPILVRRETLEAPVPVKWLREVRTLQGVDSEAEQREALALARNSKQLSIRHTVLPFLSLFKQFTQ
jgi:hypothetical protein